jgi:pimeloyl-ACP methyl ester carboxylesterase
MNDEWKNNPEQAKASSYVPKIQGPDGEKFLSDNNFAMIRNFMGIDHLKDGGILSKEDYGTIMDIISRPGTMTAWCNYYRAAQTRGLEKDQPEKKMPAIMINVPVLVIWGMKDHALLPGLLNGLEEYVPDLRVKRVPEGTHQVVHEEPELINKYMREFLAG